MKRTKLGLAVLLLLIGSWTQVYAELQTVFEIDFTATYWNADVTGSNNSGKGSSFTDKNGNGYYGYCSIKPTTEITAGEAFTGYLNFDGTARFLLLPEINFVDGGEVIVEWGATANRSIGLFLGSPNTNTEDATGITGGCGLNYSNMASGTLGLSTFTLASTIKDAKYLRLSANNSKPSTCNSAGSSTYIKKITVKTNSKICTPPTASFALVSVTEKMGVAVSPNLFTTNNTSAVAYESSNTSVATVNSTTGVITLVSPGQTTIKAKQDDDDTYCSVQATYVLTVDPEYSIAAISNNTTYGTVDISGNVITATPTRGYGYASPAYTVAPANSATVVQDGNEFTVNATANTTVTINFAEIAKKTIELDAGSGSVGSASVTEEYGGEGVTLPAAAPCPALAAAGWIFAGWATEATTETTIAPALVPTNYIPAGNLTLYAVYRQVGESSSWTFNDVGTGKYSNTSIEVDENLSIITAAGEVTITASTGNAGGISYTKYLDLGGSGSITNRVVKVHLTEAGTLTVYNNGADNNRIIAINNGSAVISDNTSNNTKVCNIASPGDYYIYSAGSGIRVYAIKFEKVSTYHSNPSCQLSDLVWNGSSGDDWNTPANWTPAQVPTTVTDITIPGGLTSYPVLSGVVNCNNIHFGPGAELGNPQYLQYSTAEVEFNLSDINRDQYYTVGAPLKNMVVGDFSFGGSPFSYAKYADVSIAGEGELIQGFTEALPDYNIPLSLGFGFAYKVAAGGYNGQLTFPHFMNQPDNETDAKETHNRHHQFQDGTSTFYYYNTGTLERTTKAPATVSRLKTTINETQVYVGNRFIAENENNIIPAEIAIPLTGGNDLGFLVSNPLMSHINFANLFIDDNNPDIEPYFRLWNGTSLYTVTISGSNTAANPYEGDGITDVLSSDLLIAPMQAFFVEKSGATDNLIIKPADVSTVKSGGASLRADNKADTNKESLKVIARAATGASAIVLNREENREEYSIPKIFTFYEDVPELYIVGEKPVEIREMDNSITSVPLGIRTLEGTEINLTFSGLNTFTETVSLYDVHKGTTTEINETAHAYSFVNDKSGMNNRFFLLFAPAAPTGINQVSKDNLLVTYTDHAIHVVSSPLNRIHSVKVYNLQGQLISVKENLSTITLDVNTTGKGIYVVDVVTENARNIKKVLTY
jgi:hypothetical protein